MDGLRKLAVVIVALGLIIVLLSSLAGARPWSGLGPSWGMGPGMMGWGMGPRQAAPSQPAQPPASARGADTVDTGLPWVLVIILVAGVVLLAWLIVPRTRRTAQPIQGRETPLEIAKRRYVTGEISLPEYEEILRVLTASGETLDGVKGQVPEGDSPWRGPGSKTP